MSNKKLQVEIIGKNAGLKRALNDSKKDTQSFGKELRTMAKHAAEAFAIFEGAKKVTEFLVDATKAAAAAQVSQARLNVTLKDAGIGWTNAGKAVTGYLQKQAEVTGFMRNDLSEAMANNIRSTQSVAKSQKLLSIEMDVARTKNISLAAASSLVNRVYNGSYIGLKKLGIGYTKTTENVDALKLAHEKAAAAGQKFTKGQMIEYHAALDVAKAHDKAANRAQAIALVKKKFAGQSAAYAKTEAGMIERLKAQYEELQIKIGKKLLPVVSKVAKFILEIASAKSLTVAVKIAFNKGKELAKDLYDSLAEAIGGGSHQKFNLPTKSMITVDDKGLSEKFQEAFQKVNWTAVGRTVIAGLGTALQKSQEAFNKMSNALSQWANGPGGSAAAEAGLVIGLKMLSKLLDPSFWIAHWQLIGGIILSAMSILFPEGKLAQIGIKGIAFLLKPFTKLGTKLAGIGVEAVLSLSSKIAEKLGPLAGDIALWIGNALLKAAGMAVKAAISLGAKIISAIINKFAGLGAIMRTILSVGIVTVIGNMIGAAVGAAGRLVSAVVGAIKSIPSKLTGLAGDMGDKIKSAIGQVAGEVGGWAKGIGSAIYHGIMSGIGNIKGAIMSKLKGIPGVSHIPGLAVGGKVTSPRYMVGEEAPQHPEWVIASNPAYRERNVALWHQAGNALGVPGFKKGGKPKSGGAFSGLGHEGSGLLGPGSLTGGAAGPAGYNSSGVAKARAAAAHAAAAQAAAKKAAAAAKKTYDDLAGVVTKDIQDEGHLKDLLHAYKGPTGKTAPKATKTHPHPDVAGWTKYDANKTSLYNLMKKLKEDKAKAATAKAAWTKTKGGVTDANSALNDANSALNDAKQQAAEEAQGLADAIPGTDAFGSSIDALMAQLSEDSYYGRGDAVKGDLANLISAYQSRIGTISGLRSSADPARLDAINQELPNDYSSLADFQDQLTQGAGGAGGAGGGDTGSNGPTADESAQLEQLRQLGYTALKGKALAAAAAGVMGGHTVNVNMNALHPGSDSVLQAVGNIVTSALDRQPSIGTSRQTILV